jgi:carbamoyl-phosphate synthase small subunit
LTGYQEILTDPSYAGQIVVMTYPQIGNYGANVADTESTAIHATALVVREISEIASNFASEESTLESYLQKNNIACMSEVDTRALTRALRDQGAMKGTFVAEGESLEEAKARVDAFDYGSTDYSAKVSGKQDLQALGVSNLGRRKVAVMDFGIKSNIIRIISQFADVDIFTLESWNDSALESYDGFFLSNGPGDPVAVDGAIPVIQKMLETGKPLFGICMGHQLLSLALGAKTYKLKFGHHGANHPVKNLIQDTVEISSQNHGYAVDGESFPSDLNVVQTHVNMNDGSLAGIMLKDKPVYSIQYHPEACPGPHDSEYLFQQFKKNLLGAAS